uniref:EF-hand domain family, member B n=1 Tax=Cyprinus carpio TaxID=7962 RepID=A0A8C1JTB1_CYPCA
MSVTERNSSTWRRRDTFPNIRAAGKLIPVDDTTKTILQEITPRTVTPPVVRKFVTFSNDPDIASTQDSHHAGLVINLAPKTCFQERLRHFHEVRVQGPGLPSWLDAEKSTFGVTMLQLSNGGEVNNPTKTTHQVKKEADEGHQLYIRSHGSYFVGQLDCKCNCNHFRRDSRFGVPTPRYNDVRTISSSLWWPCDSLMHNRAKLVSKRCDDFREKAQLQTGKVHDPIAETLNVPSDHTFGGLMKPDSFGLSDLLHQTPSDEYLKGKDRQRAVVSAVRQHLKKSNYQNFGSLLEEFKYCDKKGQGKIDKEDLKEVCHQFNMIISDPVLDDLMDYCDVNKDGLIGFMEFSNFLNWKDKLPINRVEQKILTGEWKAWTAPANMQRTDLQESSAVKPLIRPEDLEPVEVGISSDCFSLIDDHTYGEPTVRIAQIFQKVGLSVAEETFEEAWKLTSMRHPAGDVCMENFRNVLGELRAN